MPKTSPAIRPIVYPGGQFRSSREVAAINHPDSPERLPEKIAIDVYDDGEGWPELLEAVLKYNAVTEDDAIIYAERVLIEPAMSRPKDAVWEASVMGVKARFIKRELFHG